MMTIDGWVSPFVVTDTSVLCDTNYMSFNIPQPFYLYKISKLKSNHFFTCIVSSVSSFYQFCETLLSITFHLVTQINLSTLFFSWDHLSGFLHAPTPVCIWWIFFFNFKNPLHYCFSPDLDPLSSSFLILLFSC